MIQKIVIFESILNEEQFFDTLLRSSISISSTYPIFDSQLFHFLHNSKNVASIQNNYTIKHLSQEVEISPNVQANVRWSGLANRRFLRRGEGGVGFLTAENRLKFQRRRGYESFIPFDGRAVPFDYLSPGNRSIERKSLEGWVWERIEKRFEWGRRGRRSSHFGYEVPRGRNDARDNLWPCSNRLEHRAKRCQLVSRGWPISLHRNLIGRAIPLFTLRGK